MLELLPQEISSEIVELLPTKDRARLILVNKTWRDLTRLCVNWHSIRVSVQSVNMPSLRDWLSSVDYRSANSVSCIEITPRGLLSPDYVSRFHLLARFSSLTSLQLRETTQGGKNFVVDDKILAYLTRLKQLRVLDLCYSPRRDYSGTTQWIRELRHVYVYSLKSLAAFERLESLSCSICLAGEQDSIVALSTEFCGLTALRALTLCGTDHMLAVNATLRELFVGLTHLHMQNLKCGNEGAIAAPSLQHCQVKTGPKFDHLYDEGTIAFSEALVSISICERDLSVRHWNVPSSSTKMELLELDAEQEHLSSMAAIQSLAAFPNLRELKVVNFDWSIYETSEALEPFVDLTSLVNLGIEVCRFGDLPVILSNCDNKFNKLTKLMLTRVMPDRNIVLSELSSFPCLEVATINALASGRLESQSLRSLEITCVPNLHGWLDMNAAASKIFGELPNLESFKLHLEDSSLQEVEAVVRQLGKLPSLQDLVLTYEKGNTSQPLAASGDGFIETCCWALTQAHTLKSLELACTHDRVHLFRVGLPAAIKLRVLCAGLFFGVGFGLHPATRTLTTI